MNRSGAEIRASEAQSKFIQDRITTVERDFGQLCDTFSSYTRKSARLRDKGDLLAKELIAHVEKETLNPSTKKGVTDFAAVLASVQDYRQAQVARLEAKVVAPMSSYGLICKQAKAELKATFAAQQREQKSKRQLDKVRQNNPSDRHQISKAETALQKASVDASRTSKSLEQQMDNFEKKKLKDLKKVLSDFVNIELHFHAKALELYTNCFKGLASINEDEDLEEFRNYLYPPQSASRMGMARTASQRSLNSSVQSDFYTQTPPTSARRLPQPNTPTRQQQVHTHQNGVDEEDDEDDSEEYSDEYEDEESEDEVTETPRPAPNTRVVQVKR
ncbi:CBY1-interacting BAR domain-containing protein 1-like [Liolophura sinensis]|uniref:CBY1-interacting BAR domain-containing protein 1-like n=1 Tax=Liolophura sinensis TaxID=3198878 RepID=UPI003158E395